MIKLIIFGVCICLIIMLATKQPAMVRSRFHGHWSGSLEPETGSFTVLIGDNGEITGTLITGTTETSISGKVDKTGELVMITAGSEQQKLVGSINEVSGSGIITDNNSVVTGNWNILKQ